MNDASGMFNTSKRDVKTAISSDIEMSIRKIDWKRIYRKVGLIPRGTSIYDVVENVAWGVSGSALLSLIPLYQATATTGAWVRPTFWIVALAAAVVAMLAHYFTNERRGVIQSSADEVLTDMRDVYATFFSDGSLENTGGPTSPARSSSESSSSQQ